MFGLNGVPVVACWGAGKEVGDEGPARAAGVTGIGVDEEEGCSNSADLEGVGDCRKLEAAPGVGDAAPESRNLDGDLESDLRSDRTAEPTSTWCTCVGEGRVSVPPLPLENDMVGVVLLLFCLTSARRDSLTFPSTVLHKKGVLLIR